MSIRIIKILQLLTYWPFKFIFVVLFCYKVKGIDNLRKAGSSFILTSNHISYFDPVLVAYSLPFKLKYFPLYYMTDDFLYKILFFYRFIGGIPARKGQGLDVSISPFLKKLENGGIIVIFPEGGIKRKQELRPKRGISYMAAKSGKPIIPIKIDSDLDGSISVFGDKLWRIFLMKKRVTIIFGKPFKIEETIGKTPVTDNELIQASEEVLKRIKELK